MPESFAKQTNTDPMRQHRAQVLEGAGMRGGVLRFGYNWSALTWQLGTLPVILSSGWSLDAEFGTSGAIMVLFAAMTAIMAAASLRSISITPDEISIHMPIPGIRDRRYRFDAMKSFMVEKRPFNPQCPVLRMHDGRIIRVGFVTRDFDKLVTLLQVLVPEPETESWKRIFGASHAN